MPTFPTLLHLRDLRQAAGVTPTNIENITGARRGREPARDIISIDRLRLLERTPAHEPTYAEAVTLARILLLPGIMPLISAGTLSELAPVLGPDQPTDINHFRITRDVPLSIACRIALSVGLDDPIELEHLPIHAQVWSILEVGERAGALATCPWCLGSAGLHLPTCLPAALWGPRSLRPHAAGEIPRLGQPRTRGDSRYAHGLKTMLARSGKRQQDVASTIGVHANYLSTIVRCERPLTMRNADRLAEVLGCRVEELFA